MNVCKLFMAKYRYAWRVSSIFKQSIRMKPFQHR